MPELVRQRAVALGAPGRAWLATVHDVAGELAERWELRLERILGGGTAAAVIAAVDAHDRPCVLKIAMAFDDEGVDAFRRAVIAHELADGHGCAELYRADHDAAAMLLERLGPNLDDLAVPVPEMLEAIATTLRDFWRPVDPTVDLPDGAEAAAWLSNFITTTWDDLGRPCPRTVIDRAVDYCEQRAGAFDPDDAVLVHGDAHGWNTLRAPDGSHKFVDPEGVRSDRAHDLGIPMREYNHDLLVDDTVRRTRARAERLASLCDVDPEAVWQWGFIERVSTGLANARDFEGDEADVFFEVAERCL